MNILVINCGSSSLKYQLIDSANEKVLAKGLCERIGIEGSCISHTPAGGSKVKEEIPMPDHVAAVNAVISKLTDETVGVVKSLSEIDAVGHRIVHGGEKFATSVVIDDEVIAAIEEVSDLAPLHNPANLIGIRSCQKLMPGVPQVAVFDTAFHQTMPKKAYLYGLPYEYYEKYKVRRYGFHGTSHDYVSSRIAEIFGQKREDMKIIVCHLGNGASVSAVDGGKCVDTSMGLTPLEGLIMGTRSGDMDPAIIGFLAQKEGKSAEEIINICNKKSGVLGLSGGVSSDFR
ncbi:MAG: acetate kinase, partial [Lachnospiraceae bacterium]|nr:acetate kinase [Lachnospiraceae bacterium]